MQEKIRITADTNILVSALLSKGNESEFIRKAEQGKFKLILSFPILEELREVISRQRFNYSFERINQFLAYIISISEIILPSVELDIIKEDPDDNKILECAISGKADYIVSGDKHLLNIKEYEGVRIIRTQEALRIIENV